MPSLKKIHLSDKAEADFIAAAAAYLHIQESLSARFYRDVIRYLGQIQQFPKAQPMFNKRYRYLVMQDFPYFLIYLERDDDIVVDAIAHAHMERNSMLG